MFWLFISKLPAFPLVQKDRNYSLLKKMHPKLYLPEDFVKTIAHYRETFSMETVETLPLINTNLRISTAFDKGLLPEPAHVSGSSVEPSEPSQLAVKFNSKVILFSPTEIYSDTVEKKVESPLNNLRFLVLRRQNGAILLPGGAWSHERDGGNPLLESDCLIRTAMSVFCCCFLFLFTSVFSCTRFFD